MNCSYMKAKEERDEAKIYDNGNEETEGNIW